jgi:hypothetical protein
MYNVEIGKEIEKLYKLAKRAKTSETCEKHLEKIELLKKELFGK